MSTTPTRMSPLHATRKIWVWRHGRVLLPPGLCYGQLDVEPDLAHARECAQRGVQALDWARIGHIRVSDLRRTRALADAALLALQDTRPQPGHEASWQRAAHLRLHYETDARLREMDFGCWEGIAWNDIPPPALQAWTDDFPHHAFGGRENLSAMLARVQAALSDSLNAPYFHTTVRPQAPDDKPLTASDTSSEAAPDVLWITHAGVARCLQLLRAGYNADRLQACDWPREAPGWGEWVGMEFPAVALEG